MLYITVLQQKAIHYCHAVTFLMHYSQRWALISVDVPTVIILCKIMRLHFFAHIQRTCWCDNRSQGRQRALCNFTQWEEYSGDKSVPWRRLSVPWFRTWTSFIRSKGKYRAPVWKLHICGLISEVKAEGGERPNLLLENRGREECSPRSWVARCFFFFVAGSWQVNAR